jgi:hypothetical protein
VTDYRRSASQITVKIKHPLVPEHPECICPPLAGLYSGDSGSAINTETAAPEYNANCHLL